MLLGFFLLTLIRMRAFPTNTSSSVARRCVTSRTVSASDCCEVEQLLAHSRRRTRRATKNFFPIILRLGRTSRTPEIFLVPRRVVHFHTLCLEHGRHPPGEFWRVQFSACRTLSIRPLVMNVTSTKNATSSRLPGSHVGSSKMVGCLRVFLIIGGDLAV